jgi:hypothetical protein
MGKLLMIGFAITLVALAARAILKTLREIKQNETNRHPTESNSSLSKFKISTKGWPSAIFVKSASRKNQKYKVNLNDQKCQCGDFEESRNQFAWGDPRRFCKHMVSAVLDNSGAMSMPPVVYKILTDAREAGRGLHYDQYKIATLDGKDVIVSRSDRGEWYSVITETSSGVERFGYNILELRWAYKRTPQNAETFIDLINGWNN